MNPEKVTQPTVVAHPGQSLKRDAAARFLGMCPESFDRIKGDIVSSPILPGSPVSVWMVSDLVAWRESQKPVQSIEVPNLATLIYQLP